LDATDSSSKWDFKKYTPDAVVFNLFQNDAWLFNMPEYEEFKHRFGSKAPGENYIIQSYKNFVKKYGANITTQISFVYWVIWMLLKKVRRGRVILQRLLLFYMTGRFTLIFLSLRIQAGIHKLLNKKRFILLKVK
jgi:hypothetical protein